ncbi:hypothetical protein Tco_1310405 [Tanacetum coccineum]
MLDFVATRGLNKSIVLQKLHTKGVAVEMNRTLIATARTMFKGARFSLITNTFWAKAVSIALLYFYRCAGKFDGNLRRDSFYPNRGTSEVTNSAGTPTSIASGDNDDDSELIVMVQAFSPTPTLRIHSIHPKSQILGDPKSAVQTRSKVQNKSGAHALLSHIHKQQRNNHKDQQHCLFACFLLRRTYEDC